MKEKVAKSQRTGLVMDCIDFVVLAFLLMACCTIVVSANGDKKELNGKCLVIQDCKKMGYMCSRNMTCQCKSGYMPNKEWTRCLGVVNSRCTYDTHCMEGAYCTGTRGSETCQCKEEDNYYLNDNGITCANSAIRRHQQGFSFLKLLALLGTSLYLNT